MVDETKDAEPQEPIPMTKREALSESEKMELIIKSVKILIQLDTNGQFHEVEPGVRIVTERKDDEWIRTAVELEFKANDGEAIVSNGNWNGLGRNHNECLTGNLVCIAMELESKIKMFQDLSKEIFDALPEAYRKNLSRDINPTYRNPHLREKK